jgi:Ni/Fe-hydrogenase subunit HybB-like protein
MFTVEMVVGLMIPTVLLVFRRVRGSPRWLAVGCFLVMLGVILNRTNVYWIGYRPPFTDTVYTPSLVEWGLTIGLVAGLILVWRALAIYFPVITLSGRARPA